MNKSIEVSAVVTVGRRYDDSGTLASEYLEALRRSGRTFELIFVLDGERRRILPHLIELAKENIEVRIAGLPGSRLGETQGTTITLDIDGAGYGWFVDATPWANEEFGDSTAYGLVADPSGPAADRMDLLTVVLHELGHALGQVDLDDILSDDVMNGWLPAGVRRT